MLPLLPFRMSPLGRLEQIRPNHHQHEWTVIRGFELFGALIQSENKLPNDDLLRLIQSDANSLSMSRLLAFSLVLFQFLLQ
jgi:hypothetical protein